MTTTLLTVEDVYANLCIYDSRHPGYAVAEYDEGDVPRDDCFCDNCTYGRDSLAIEILLLRSLLYGEDHRRLAARRGG